MGPGGEAMFGVDIERRKMRFLSHRYLCTVSKTKDAMARMLGENAHGYTAILPERVCPEQTAKSRLNSRRFRNAARWARKVRSFLLGTGLSLTLIARYPSVRYVDIRSWRDEDEDERGMSREDAARKG